MFGEQEGTKNHIISTRWSEFHQRTLFPNFFLTALRRPITIALTRQAEKGCFSVSWALFSVWFWHSQTVSWTVFPGKEKVSNGKRLDLDNVTSPNPVLAEGPGRVWDKVHQPVIIYSPLCPWFTLLMTCNKTVGVSSVPRASDCPNIPETRTAHRSKTQNIKLNASWKVGAES